jgi:hypothetical protein
MKGFVMPDLSTLGLQLLFILTPFLSQDRDWRYFEEFEKVQTWYNRVDDECGPGDRRCTQVICPGGTPERFYLYIHPGRDWLVDHVEIGVVNEWGNYTFRRIEKGQVGKHEWRAVVGDFDNIVLDGETFHIRVWCVEKINYESHHM